MNDRLKESLSALLDGEVNELELQRILSYENRQEVSIYWERYHQVSALLKAEASLYKKVDVRASVMALIHDDEPPHKA